MIAVMHPVRAGLGGIFGAKQLKAISVIGTGGVPVDDPAYLLQLRRSQKDNYEFIPDDIRLLDQLKNMNRYNSRPAPSELYTMTPAYINSRVLDSLNRREDKRSQSCMGCHSGCKARYANAKANEATCIVDIIREGRER